MKLPKIKLPKVTLDAILSIVFIIGLVVALFGLLWIISGLVWLAFVTALPLGILLSGLLLMGIAYGISLLSGIR